ncbi:G-protein-coupled receptor family 3 protein 4 [Dictyostelium discoideum AX4]|uniref:Metabotropic glutamate receptor-like protein D n=1 Tax=Dictyostelium discoideum TaxID=44689 RepID=GRLD_DICDI|nr:G-protein-coupled receptor family 3 protein 4 [Dictyostelium discoideum AX4]Q54L53.1 RecName: Full=Metabotropic glutamate receptor-like protein D; Flags: Precursor [Dictyostelium discoideum]EAL64005.1 G-protein-coupled receptor family 3 protein 4 [Dictyostelium discoideum AX4]|eukprot:XP_637510.1 G-protein-coupled receptor family 3 protein 4 [Dictyostelium discoideum AX4]
MKINSFLIILILLFISIKNSNGEPEKKFKLITLLAAHVQDLGFNNMVNRGHVEVSKAMKLEDSQAIVVVGYNDTIRILAPLVAVGDVDLVICSSQDHAQACRELATKYKGSSIKTQFLVRGSGEATSNLITYSYNYANANYISGYFAGLYTKTNKIGFLSPGAIDNNNDSFVYAFWYGAKRANPDISFYYYNIGNYLNPDKTVAATKDLLDMGCDMVADTLNDFSTGNTLIANNRKTAMGTSGFPQRDVYGEDVIYSYNYNWFKLFYPVAQSVYSGNTNNTNWYADFNLNETISFFGLSFSFTVPNETLTKFYEELDYLKRTPRLSHPYFCNDLMYEYAKKNHLTMSTNDSTHCLANSQFTRINAPFPGMTWLGNYEITLTEVYQSRPIQIAISSISSFFIVTVLVMMGLVVRFRKNPSIRSASPIFLNFILFGALIIYVGIIIWSSSINSASCNAQFWLVTLGFTTLIGSLVVKNVRIWLIFDNPELKLVKITNLQLVPWVGVCLVINIILMSILTSVGDLREVNAQGIDSLGKYEFMRICKMNSSGASTLYTILAYFAALLLIGVFVSWKIRIVDILEFNESKAIANTLYAISFCLFVIVPLMISPQDKQSEKIILCIAGLFIVTAAVLIIFVPKFYRVYIFGSGGTSDMFYKKKKQSPVATARAESTSKGSSGGGAGSGGATGGSGVKTNKRGNLVSGDFSDDTESSLSEPNKPVKVVAGAVLAEFTDDTISDLDNIDQPIEIITENGQDSNNNNNNEENKDNNIENNKISEEIKENLKNEENNDGDN